MSAPGVLPTARELLTAPGQPFIHRDLSWLQFNERVLAEADEPTTPLLERVKFLAISSSNLDEFFMIRFASLGRSIRRLHRKEMHAEAKQLKRIQDLIIEHVLAINRKQRSTLRKLAKELAGHGIFGVLPGEAIAKDPRVAVIAKELFDQQILPQLDRTGSEGGFRRLRQLNELGNLQAAAVFAPEQVWIPIPKSLPAVLRYTAEGSGEIFVFFLDQLLLEYLGGALGMKNRPSILRLTRDGDLLVDLEEEDTESIPDVVRSSIGTRDRGRPVRLQCLGEIPKPLLEMVAQAIRVHPSTIMPASDTLLLHGLWSLVNNLPEKNRAQPGALLPPYSPGDPAVVQGRNAGFRDAERPRSPAAPSVRLVRCVRAFHPGSLSRPERHADRDDGLSHRCRLSGRRCAENRGDHEPQENPGGDRASGALRRAQ